VAPKLYVSRISVLLIACHSRCGVVLIDLEYFLHPSVRQFLFEVAHGRGPGRREFVHPAIVEESDRRDAQEMPFLAPMPQAP
jgi:hypothetical protein